MLVFHECGNVRRRRLSGVRVIEVGSAGTRPPDSDHDRYNQAAVLRGRLVFPVMPGSGGDSYPVPSRFVVCSLAAVSRILRLPNNKMPPQKSDNC